MITFMVEPNIGYAIGINLESSLQIDVKLMYPFQKFGFAIEAGTILTQEKAHIHVFLGPMMFLYNNNNWRIPVSLGINLFNGKTLYFGFGGFVSAHYKLTKNIYTGFNLGISYAFNNVYDEFTGFRTETVKYNEGTLTRDVPVYERKDHYGSYIYIKPSLMIGFQF